MATITHTNGSFVCAYVVQSASGPYVWIDRPGAESTAYRVVPYCDAEGYAMMESRHPTKHTLVEINGIDPGVDTLVRKVTSAHTFEELIKSFVFDGVCTCAKCRKLAC